MCVRAGVRAGVRVSLRGYNANAQANANFAKAPSKQITTDDDDGVVESRSLSRSFRCARLRDAVREPSGYTQRCVM